MTDLILSGGPVFMIPLVILAVAVLGLAIRTAWLLASRRADAADRPLNLLFHLGIFSFVWGLLGHAVSLYQMVTAIEAAGSVAPAIVAGGLRVSFIVPLTGLVILAVAMLLWIAFKLWRDRTGVAAAGPA